MNARTRITMTAAAALLGAATTLFAQERELEAQESYSYVRTLDGRATLASQGSAPGEEATVNQPLLTGDRVAVARGARVEIALADRNLVRVGGGSVLVLTRVAFSGDRGERSTLLDLEDGELVLTVTEDALGDALPEVRTPGGEVVIHRPGTYRIATAPEGWTEVVVREGFAEVVTGRGSTLVREAESAYVALSRQGADIADAGPFDSLERWGDELAAGARQAELYVEPELSYQAAPLADYGSWVSVNSAWYWQPRVAAGWRPYWDGRWGWTPSGLTWISDEPWGWMPYHYGSWASMPGYGWLWRPGRLYSPAWVYWHWSDDWVGWCPTGYYTNWYGPWGYGYGSGYGYGYGFRCGIYGWAGGNWGFYNDWNFAPNYCLRRRDQRRHHRRGGDLGRELGPHVPRGLVTTETRGLPRERLGDRGFVRTELARRGKLRPDADFADVTDFVARKRDLPRQVSDVIRSEPGARVRLAEVPEAADGRPRAGDRGRGDSNTNADADTRGRRGDGSSGDGDGNGRVFTRPRGDGDAGTTVTRPHESARRPAAAHRAARRRRGRRRRHGHPSAHAAPSQWRHESARRPAAPHRGAQRRGAAAPGRRGRDRLERPRPPVPSPVGGDEPRQLLPLRTRQPFGLGGPPGLALARELERDLGAVDALPLAVRQLRSPGTAGRAGATRPGRHPLRRHGRLRPRPAVAELRPAQLGRRRLAAGRAAHHRPELPASQRAAVVRSPGCALDAAQRRSVGVAVAPPLGRLFVPVRLLGLGALARLVRGLPFGGRRLARLLARLVARAELLAAPLGRRLSAAAAGPHRPVL
ncbi:MAG: FecR family protein [Acidobacteria bacterium]|nr:FecR family protein [Acidobacteriota bacterium]